MLEPTWTTVNDAAERLGLSRRHVFRLIGDYDVATAREKVPGSNRWMTTVDLTELRKVRGQAKPAQAKTSASRELITAARTAASSETDHDRADLLRQLAAEIDRLAGIVSRAPRHVRAATAE